jgi:hypothetical protein
LDSFSTIRLLFSLKVEAASSPETRENVFWNTGHHIVCTTALIARNLACECTLEPVLSHVLSLKVEESRLRRFPHRDRERLTAQLILDIVQPNVGAGGRLELTCLSTIPAVLEPEQTDYADRRTSSVTGEEQKLANSCGCRSRRRVS